MTQRRAGEVHRDAAAEVGQLARQKKVVLHTDAHERGFPLSSAPPWPSTTGA